jgi:broad specificity phosphatase PhoE
VLVSPHQRALETCNEVYGDRNIPIEVHPILAEVFRFSCDISQHIEEKKKQFPKFDFTHMKDHSELWFIEILSEKHAKNTYDHI